MRAAGIPVSLEEMRNAFYEQLPGEIKKELILHDFVRLEARKPHAGAYKAVYDEALMIENALRTTGTFTPRGTKTPGPPKRTHEQRLAAIGDGSRRGGGDSQRSNKRGNGTSLMDQFCLAHAARTLDMGVRDCGSSYECCASHNKSLHEFYKVFSGTAILDKFPYSTRKWTNENIEASASRSTLVPPSAPSPAVVADLQNQIAALSAQFGSSRITLPPAAVGANEFITSDSGCCYTVGALAPYVARQKAQSFDSVMVESVVAYTGCSQNEAFASLMQCEGDMSRTSGNARKCVSPKHDRLGISTTRWSRRT